MCAVLDDGLSALDRALAAEVCYSLLCYYDIDIVFGVVYMAAEWYDG